MTTKPKAKKFRIRRGGALGTTPAPAQDASVPQPSNPQPTASGATTAPEAHNIDTPQQVANETTLEDIRREGLTGRQLRMARRVAQKHGLAVTSDFDAVRQLRAAGIDPFQRNTILELVAPDGAKPPATQGQGGQAIGRIQLPQTVPTDGNTLPSTERASPADRRAREIMDMQRDMVKRRRRRLVLLFTRLSFFVFLPTFLIGWYFFFIATPMYATKSEFIIQQAEPAGAAGLGGLFQGTSMATQQDSIAVQSYLASRAAMVRLDADYGFKDHFSAPNIDSIQRLDPDSTNEAAYGVYSDRVRVSYDPTEGILRMEVVAADPATSQEFSEALIGYAEEQVDQLTQRLREDQMAGARTSFEDAQKRRSDALDVLSQLQAQAEIIDPVSESGALLQRVTNLEIQRDAALIELQSLLDNARPNQARVDAARAAIARLDTSISGLRTEMASNGGTDTSLSDTMAQLRKAEENYQTELLMLQQAQTMMEAAQVEANRQVRYLSLGVEPVAPDEPTYPRAFENTVLGFLIFAGIYLMISLTASILREQVTA